MLLGLSGKTAASAEDSSGKLRVMPLGDSITDGFTTTGGYRNTLCELLVQNGFSERVDFVGPNWGGSGYDPQHAGYSGYSIDNIPQEASISGQRTGISSFIEWLMEEYPADVVMLQIGTNDILSHYDLANIGTRLESLVDTILGALPEDGMLYLATIPCMDAENHLYINEYYFTTEYMDECVDAYNASIREIAERKSSEGKRIALADVNAVLGKGDLCDGVHPSVDGYAKLGSFWYDKLAAFMEGGEAAESYSAADLVMLAKHIVGRESIPDTAVQRFDLDGDGILSSLDMVILRRKYC